MDDDLPAVPTLSPAVLRVLVDNHQRFLGFLERRLGRRDVAEEILQEAFVRGVSRGGALREEESAVAWFYRLLRHALIDHHRRSSVEARKLASFAQEPLDEESPDAALADAVCACVTALVETLKPEYATAIHRVDLGNETVQAFARSTGITPGNAAVRLFRARQALRRRVEQSCGTCATHGCYQCACQSSHPPIDPPSTE